MGPQLALAQPKEATLSTRVSWPALAVLTQALAPSTSELTTELSQLENNPKKTVILAAEQPGRGLPWHEELQEQE